MARARRRRHARALVAGAALLGAIGAPGAEPPPRTVCTITVNSADEKEALVRVLPAARHRFVELVEAGRPDWLETACRRRVSCDVLVVSGHYDGGNEFFSDRLESHEYLTVAELERASCSKGCASLFARLKEVYLFGCNTLNPMPQGSATAEVIRSLVREGGFRNRTEPPLGTLTAGYGENSRDRMRQIFKDVPLVYGFSSTAPLGPIAGAVLERALRQGGGRAFGTGRPSPRLLGAFAPYGMSHARGIVAAETAQAAARRDMCSFADAGRTDAQRIRFVHEVLQRHVGEARLYLDRIQRVMGSIDEAARARPDVAAALRSLAADGTARERFLDYARASEQLVRMRMLEVARELGWLAQEQLWVEQAALLAELQARPQVGVAELNLACSLNAGHEFDGTLSWRMTPGGPADDVPHAALQACLGSEPGAARTLAALLAPDEADAQIAQAYLRHRPVTDPAMLRALAAGVADMPDSPAQVRAIEALGRHYLSDPAILDLMTDLFSRTPSPQVQTAVAGLLLRADRRALSGARLLPVLRAHRRTAPDADDLVDALIQRLQSS